MTTSLPQPRVQRGVPTGGRWTTSGRSEPDVTLDWSQHDDPWADISPSVTRPQVSSDPDLVLRDANGTILHHIRVTEHNADLLASLTQTEIDENSDAYLEACREEIDRLQAAFTADDLLLPVDPTPGDIRRVATQIDAAFADVEATLSNIVLPGPQQALIEVYGTPDRALVAIGRAIAARADLLADGHATGGAEATERWFLERAGTAEETDKERFLGLHRDTYPELLDSDILALAYTQSPEAREITDARDPKTRAALDDMAEAYLAALSEVRPLGGTLALHEESSKPGAKVAAATAGIWPTSWLQTSNACAVPLHIGSSTRRGHYTHETKVDFRRRGQGGGLIRDYGESIIDWEASRNSLTGPVMTRVTEPESKSAWRDGDKYRTYVSYTSLTPEEKTAAGFDSSDNSYRSQEWEIAYGALIDHGYARILRSHLAHAGVDIDEFKPDDIDYLESLIDSHNSSTAGAPISVTRPAEMSWDLISDPSINDGSSFYRRPKIRQNRVGAQRVSQIKLSNDRVAKVPGQDPRYAVAVHEIGHRMEYLVPNLNRMVRSWRERRVNESLSPEGRELRTIYRGTSERGYSDDFPSHYIGRYYDNRDNRAPVRQPRGSTPEFVEATEVFSMGSDSIFAGRNGGLIGLSRTQKPDPDMRAFILGVFATAGLAHEEDEQPTIQPTA